MKTYLTLLIALVIGTSAKASINHSATAPFGHGDSVIFTENGITFSVFPNGEFDFYLNNHVNVNANVNVGNVNLSFNSGYDYDAYVQYDDYGAVIQVENVPIYYDYYGRVSRIGSVYINYNNGRLARVGGLYVHYNPRGVFTHYTGYINVYNRHYVYRPYYNWFIAPRYSIVYHSPYRRYYTPVRYRYYSPYRNNYRPHTYAIGKQVRYKGIIMVRNIMQILEEVMWLTITVEEMR